MKMKKIIGFFIVMLLIVSTSSVASLTMQTNEKEQPRFTTSINEDIIELIQQVDETMYLGYLEDIVAFGPRVTGTSECEDAGTYIYNEFESMGLETRYQDWSYNDYEDKNIEATLPGINTTSDEIYIICAHHDSRGGVGADDDGSGVATVLSAANVFRKYTFNHTIRFVTFSGEEQYLFGSHEYAREAFENDDNIVAVLNVDMIGFAINSTHGNRINVYKNDTSKWISDFTINISQSYYDYIYLDVVPQGEVSSDQKSFWQYGYDGICYHEYERNYYLHTSNDTIENMNTTYAMKCIKLVWATLAELTNLFNIRAPPDKPTITGFTSGKAGNQYEYTFSTTDPEGDEIYYWILWFEGCPGVSWDGPYQSGEEITKSYSWESRGEYTIQVKAKDSYGTESDWSTLEVSMPKNKAINPFILFLERLMERFPILEQILQPIYDKLVGF